jgi:hypothetical protein
MFGPVDEVRQIEIRNVVSNDNVWVDFFDKVSPGLQHLCFVVERENLGADDM